MKPILPFQVISALQQAHLLVVAVMPIVLQAKFAREELVWKKTDLVWEKEILVKKSLKIAAPLIAAEADPAPADKSAQINASVDTLKVVALRVISFDCTFSFL